MTILAALQGKADAKGKKNKAVQNSQGAAEDQEDESMSDSA